MQDRSGEQVREIADEQQVVHEGVLLRLAAPRVDQEGDLRERVERDAERQDDVLDAPVGTEQRRQVLDHEAGVLVVAEHGEIARQRRDERDAARPARPARREPRDRPAHDEVPPDRGKEQPQVHRIPPAVEEQRGRGEPGGRDAVTETREQEETAEHDRQEQEDERVRVEEHGSRGRAVVGWWALWFRDQGAGVSGARCCTHRLPDPDASTTCS